VGKHGLTSYLLTMAKLKDLNQNNSYEKADERQVRKEVGETNLKNRRPRVGNIRRRVQGEILNADGGAGLNHSKKGRAGGQEKT